MSFGLSVVVSIPSNVERSVLAAIGERFAPAPLGDEEMESGEALQFAFTDPQGVADLARLGVTWEVYETGGK